MTESKPGGIGLLGKRYPLIQKATDIVHLILRDLVSPGDAVVDATCGNGHDSLFLASLIGEDGFLISMDIQKEAVMATSARMASTSVVPRFRILLASHEDLSDVVSAEDNLSGTLSAVVFNLGYLPGSDKSIITRADSTVKGLKQALELIRLGGCILVTVYTGHEGGQEEADSVESFLSSLDAKRFSTARHQWLNQSSNPPYVLIIQRKS